MADKQAEPSPQVVGVSHCDSTPLLWRMEDLRAVRSYGLVGALLGSLPRTPRQNVRLGRPLLLLPEEEFLLVEHHVAAILPPGPPDAEEAELRQQVARFEENLRCSFEEQQVLALRDRKSALIRALRSSRAESGSGSDDEDLHGRLEALERGFCFPRSALAVQLSTARAGLSHCAEDHALHLAGVATGQDPRCNTRYQVFRDLRGRGFYLTSAGKFGGDFLVYPGDPLRFHAHFIAVCVSADESMALLDVLAVARLGSNVKKTVLLCSPQSSGGVTYSSLQWSGMV
ncbi:tRNA-splicing endonuclease subunit Sen34 [Dunckerocampus dactyliophorus]|uniref:tRNA-splicing endonuclease subunit Sen34 n=1 Tax=Dunckerocampus dactyliophorus TaxID=161453 RepID=UPI00240680FB|nr:tRNA-splicing endonuclease subunit Sen34 [Dunckerocampus dactyliophorus]XP_054650950.1 tRNA-splicing endonuclease subunit Sen34 [Dunckerocampus dactyliophorus]XP_054650951.1 tRNA-splicing endonuclease subunit Sen34 [Dunckerocampus dactyliophorus]